MELPINEQIPVTFKKNVHTVNPYILRYVNLFPSHLIIFSILMCFCMVKWKPIDSLIIFHCNLMLLFTLSIHRT